MTASRVIASIMNEPLHLPRGNARPQWTCRAVARDTEIAKFRRQMVILSMLEHLLTPISFAQIITSLFLAILFLQSGLDKAFNFADNFSWLQGHFSKTVFRGQVKSMLVCITITEVLAGAVALIGAAQCLIAGQKTFAIYGAQLAALDILLLFFGQRIAKDYAGAAALVPYFILCVGEIVLLTL